VLDVKALRDVSVPSYIPPTEATAYGIHKLQIRDTAPRDDEDAADVKCPWRDDTRIIRTKLGCNEPQFIKTGETATLGLLVFASLLDYALGRYLRMSATCPHKRIVLESVHQMKAPIVLLDTSPTMAPVTLLDTSPTMAPVTLIDTSPTMAPVTLIDTSPTIAL